MRVLVVGAGTNPDFLVETLRSYGVEAQRTSKIRIPNPFLIRKFDVIYGIYLQTGSRYIIASRILGKTTITHIVGSDAYSFVRERSKLRKTYWKIVLKFSKFIFYVSPHLEGMIKKKGTVIPLPIAVDSFKSSILLEIKPDRDILYYCPSGRENEKIYRLEWITEYAKFHPGEKITIIGNSSHPADYKLNLPNVLVVPYVETKAMPEFYRKHKKLIRMTTEDGMPQMVHEAILSGIQVDFNGEEVKEVPKEREPSYFASTFKATISKGITQSGQE